MVPAASTLTRYRTLDGLWPAGGKFALRGGQIDLRAALHCALNTFEDTCAAKQNRIKLGRDAGARHHIG